MFTSEIERLRGVLITAVLLIVFFRNVLEFKVALFWDLRVVISHHIVKYTYLSEIAVYTCLIIVLPYQSHDLHLYLSPRRTVVELPHYLPFTSGDLHDLSSHRI